MRLTNKQALTLIFPFVVSSIIYMFDVEIVSNIHHLFPIYAEYSNKVLSEKTDTYLEIEKKYKLYKNINNKIELRKTNARWIAENLFYDKQEKVIVELSSKKKNNAKSYAYQLKIVYPNEKIAIINDLTVREGTLIPGAKVIKIQNNRVLLQYKKGLKWLYLFK